MTASVDLGPLDQRVLLAALDRLELKVLRVLREQARQVLAARARLELQVPPDRPDPQEWASDRRGRQEFKVLLD